MGLTFTGARESGTKTCTQSSASIRFQAPVAASGASSPSSSSSDAAVEAAW